MNSHRRPSDSRQTLLAVATAVAAVLFVALGVWVGTRGAPPLSAAAGLEHADKSVTFIALQGAQTRLPEPPGPLPAGESQATAATAARAVAVEMPAASPSPMRAASGGRSSSSPSTTVRPPAAPSLGPVSPVPAVPAPSEVVGAVPQPDQAARELVDLAGGILQPVVGLARR